MAVLDREAVAWPLGHGPVRRILMLLHSLVPLQPVSLHLPLRSHAHWKNRTTSWKDVFLFVNTVWEPFCLQSFCNWKESILGDNVHCIRGPQCVCLWWLWIVRVCGDVLSGSLQLCAEIPGCYSFSSMQMCLHMWSTNANRPICMAFLLGICMCSLSSDHVNVSSTPRLIWDSALTLGFQTKCHHCPKTSPISDLDSAQMPLSPPHFDTRMGVRNNIYTSRKTQNTIKLRCFSLIWRVCVYAYIQYIFLIKNKCMRICKLAKERNLLSTMPSFRV